MDVFNNCSLLIFIIGVLVTMLSFLAKLMVLLSYPLKILREVVEAASEDLAVPAFDWDAFMIECHDSELTISNILHSKGTGRAIVMFVASGVLAMLDGVLVAIRMHKPTVLNWISLCIYWFLGVAATFGPLYLMASLTALQKDAAVNAHSVYAVARRYPTTGTKGEKRITKMSESERLAWYRYIVFTQKSCVGIQLVGVRITREFVLTYLAKCLVYTPTLVAVLRHI